MEGAPAAAPRLLLLRALLWLLACPPARPHGAPGPLRCYLFAPLGDLNCSWEPFGELGAPSVLHLQSEKYQLNRIQTVAVPAGQSWVTIPREQLTTSDKLIVWGAAAGGPLWPTVPVNLETRVKPAPPRLGPDVDFFEDDPLEAFIQWAPPAWPPHGTLLCQFHYRRCQEADWIPLEPELQSLDLSPVEIQNLEPATHYEVSGRCRMVEEGDLWGEWCPALAFQTPPSAPKDVWVSGNVCGTPVEQEPLLLWKALGCCVLVSYRVHFLVGEQEIVRERIPCCSTPIPRQAERARVSAINATAREPLTNLSLSCLGSAPHDVVASSVAGGRELLVTWKRGPGSPRGHVVDWAADGDPPQSLSWVQLPPENLSVLLPGNFQRGVPYRITVTAVSPGGLAPAPSVWGFREELAPLAGPVLRRLQDAPPGTPVVAWGEVPRRQLRGHLTHYTLCVQSGAQVPVCSNVSGSIRNVTLPGLHWGPCELWMMASTVAGQGPRGPSLRLHLPDNTLRWKVLPGVLLLWSLLLTGCTLHLATSGRCLHLRHKVLPRWVWEKVPDPANSSSGQPHVEPHPFPGGAPAPARRGPALPGGGGDGAPASAGAPPGTRPP
ncbi:interleukin-27 receptor subunit alpha isoform X2 [Dasypus novemcinctus]|uniref:interleukin-27 receptor subunit alpha isoform X2 n=1 Tax=Dasypus novemcinctus TaxID=9361 RepID=UPI0039C91D48